MSDDLYCSKCKRYLDDELTKHGDNEIIYEGESIQMSLFLAKPINELSENDIPIMIDVRGVSIGLNVEELQEMEKGISEMRKAVQKRMQLL